MLIEHFQNLTKIDNIVFEIGCKWVIKNEFNFVDVKDIIEECKLLDINEKQIEESIEILDSKGYVNGNLCNTGYFGYRITMYGFDEYLQKTNNNYDGMLNDICLKLVNENIFSNHGLSESLKIPIIIVNHLLDLLESESLIKQTKFMGNNQEVYQVSAELKRKINIKPLS